MTLDQRMRAIDTRNRHVYNELRTYTFTFQVDGEPEVRRESFIWRLKFRPAFSLGSRLIRKRYAGVIWIEL